MDAVEYATHRCRDRAPCGSYESSTLTDTIHTLLLHAANVPSGWRRVVADTINGRLGLTPGHLPANVRDSARAQFLVSHEYETLSYVLDWKEAFERSPRLDIEFCDVNDVWAMRRAGSHMGDYDLVVALHSAAGDHLGRIRRLSAALQRRRGTLLVLFGNEYSQMPDKIAFAREVDADYIGSQLPIDSARWLYEGLSADILSAPPALNPHLYRPLDLVRDIDIGFRGVRYDDAFALGDTIRSQLLETVQRESPRLGLKADFDYSRLPREDWARFLNTCRCVVGAESGTSFLERDDSTRRAVVAFTAEFPAAPFDEVYDRFFASHSNPISGKAVSSRHFEPLGTETVQLLVEGNYNGLLEAGRHYVALKADLSNLDEACERIKDESFRAEMARTAREDALETHTYDHRVAELLRHVSA